MTEIFRFKAETMPNGNKFGAKLVCGLDAALTEMERRNVRPWRFGERELMAKFMNSGIFR